MAERGADGKYMPKVKVEPESTSKTTPTSFSAAPSAPGTSARVQQAIDDVGAAARVAGVTPAPAATEHLRDGAVVNMDAFEARLIRREEAVKQERDRQQQAAALQQQQDATSSAAAAATGGDDPTRLARAQEVADRQRREAHLQRREAEVAAAEHALKQEAGASASVAPHEAAYEQHEQDIARREAALRDRELRGGHANITHLFEHLSRTHTGTRTAPATLAATTAIIATALRKGMMVPLNFDIESGPGKLQAIRRMLEKMTKLAVSLHTPDIPDTVAAHLHGYMAQLAHQNELRSDRSSRASSTSSAHSLHAMPADLLEITATAATRSARSYEDMLAAAGEDRTLVALTDRALFETMHMSMEGKVYNAARDTVENLPASQHLFSRVLHEIVLLTQARASSTHSDLFERTVKAGRNGTVPEIMALAADRRSNQMDRPGVEMAYLLLRSLRRTHPEAAVEAQKLYDTLMADLIAGTTNDFDLQQFASDVGKYYDQEGGHVFMTDTDTDRPRRPSECSRCGRKGHTEPQCWQEKDPYGKPLPGPAPAVRPAYGTRGDAARLAGRAKELKELSSKKSTAYSQYLTACARFSSAGHDVEEMNMYVSLLIQEAPHAHSSRSSLRHWRTVYEAYSPQVDLLLSFLNDDTAEGIVLSTGTLSGTVEDDGDILDSGASATIVRDRSRHVTFNPADTVDIGGADSASGRFRTEGAGRLEVVTVNESSQAEVVSLPRSHVSDRVRRNLICLGQLVDAGYKFDLVKDDSVMYSPLGVKIPLYFDHNHMLILPRHVNNHLPFHII